MNEYYGSNLASSDFFAHYGVKGMKWGVRKAIAKGGAKGERKLARQYAKASKKLAKLTRNTDIKKQNELSNKYGKAAKVAGKIGLAGTGVLAGLHGVKGINNVLYLKNKEKAADLYQKYQDNRYDNYDYKELSRAYENKANDAARRWSFADDALDTRYGGSRSMIGTAARIAAAGGLGTAAGLKIKSSIAKLRTTDKGHAKAVSKRNEWQKQMKEAFKGTQYDTSKRTRNGNRKRRLSKA